MGEVCWSSHWGWRRREVNVRANDTCGVPPLRVTIQTRARVRQFLTEETAGAVSHMSPCGARGGMCELLWESFGIFDGRRVGVAVGTSAIAPMRIRLEVHDWTQNAMLNNPMWVRRCAFRKEHVETKNDHVEGDVDLS